MSGRGGDYAAALERAVLGLMLLEPSLVLRGERDLEAAMFEDPRHAALFETLVALGRASRDTSAAAVSIEMRRTGAWGDEDDRYLGVLVSDPGAADPRAFEERVRLLREEGSRRGAAQAMDGASRAARDRGRPLVETIGELRRSLNEIETAEGVEELPLIERAVDEVLASLETGVDPGTPTGMPNLDAAIQGGIKPGQMVVIAGSTGSGKTSLATQLALLAAQWASRRPAERGAVLMFSLEMNAIELTTRMVSQVTTISDGYRPPSGFSHRDRPRVRAALERMRALPLRVEVPRRNTVEAVRATVERHIGVHGRPSLIVVDHIGLLKDPKVRGGRTEEVGAITRGLKEMAMQLDLPLLALAQLNREVGKRDDHRPQLTDLRESGTIEQDSDIILLVYRPSYYLKDLEERRRQEEAGAEAYVMVAKNRAGPTSEVRFDWIGPRYLFRVPEDWLERQGMSDEGSLIEAALTAGPEVAIAVAPPEAPPIPSPAASPAAPSAPAPAAEDDLFA